MAGPYGDYDTNGAYGTVPTATINDFFLNPLNPGGTVPPRPAATPAASKPKSYRADLPDFGLITTKALADSAVAGAYRALDIWNSRLREELYKATGEDANVVLMSDLEMGEDGFYYYKGGRVSEEEYEAKEEQALAQEKADKKRVQSDWEKEVRAAIDDLSSYVKTVEKQKPTLPDEPKDTKATGPGTEGKPIEIGLRQFLSRQEYLPNLL